MAPTRLVITSPATLPVTVTIVSFTSLSARSGREEFPGRCEKRPPREADSGSVEWCPVDELTRCGRFRIALTRFSDRSA
ncbi:hypothetical protein GCM10023204_57190 [Actinomycetospora succinea]